MNFLDYAFIQNVIDCHDATNKADPYFGKDVQPVYTDVRNHLQSINEMYAFEVNRPAVGDKYGMYVHDGKNPLKPNNITLTNFMGERFPLHVTFGKSWTRRGSFGPYQLRTVYATNYTTGEQWTGRWSCQWDLVIMRRVK